MKNSKELAEVAAKVLDEKKGEDIVLIDIAEKSSFADYLVLATGRNSRQVAALADDVEDAFAKEGLNPKGVEGRGNTGWLLLDMGDIIVNIFEKDMRDKYSIEKVWGDCEIITYGTGDGFTGFETNEQ